MNRWCGKVAVVTGASAGIGKNVVEKLVEEGLKVVGLARRVELIEEHAKKLTGKPGKLFAYKCDVSDEEQVKTVFEKIQSDVGPVSILINNAGITYNCSVIDGDIKMTKKVIDTNLYGPCVCTQEALKQMKPANSGHIIFINSIAGHKVIDVQSGDGTIYTSTKYGITAYTEVLRQTLRNKKLNIKVTSISPGMVDTDIFMAGNYTKLNPETVQKMPHLNSEDITEGIIYVLSTKPHVQVHELMIKPMGETF